MLVNLAGGWRGESFNGDNLHWLTATCKASRTKRDTPRRPYLARALSLTCFMSEEGRLKAVVFCFSWFMDDSSAIG